MYKAAINTALRTPIRCICGRGSLNVGRKNIHAVRMMSSGGSLVRPAPPPLPREQQREFEELVRASQAPLSVPQRGGAVEQEADMTMHPDARAPLKAEFQGDINPVTGEQGGPKREPVGRWGEDEGGDWSFKGRVSDF